MSLRDYIMKDAMASWSVSSRPDIVFWVEALVGDIVLCSQARHFTPTVPFSTLA